MIQNKQTQVVSFIVIDKEAQSTGVTGSKQYSREIKTTSGVFLTLISPDPRIIFLGKGDFCSLEGRVDNGSLYVQTTQILPKPR